MKTMRQLACAALSIVVLSGCDPQGTPPAVPDGAPEAPAAAADRRGAEAATGDVEAPEVFAATDTGLWDGRPSLGGVWVAAPDARDPERVLIRNLATDRSVVGALFRRERENPGPRLQVSSDAAAALGMLAGAPAELSVVALRRVEAPAPRAAAPATLPTAPAAGAASEAVAEPGGAEAPPGPEAEGSVPDKPRPFWRRRPAEAPGSGSEDAAAGGPAAPAPAVAEAPDAPATAAPATPAGGTPAGGTLIQIGIFSVEANARDAARGLAAEGVPAEVRREESKGKTYWRVVAGPAAAADRAGLMARVKSLGFKDAYFVTR